MFFRPLRRPYRRLSEWHLEIAARPEEVVQHAHDLSAMLAPLSATLSSVAHSASGPVVSSASNTTTSFEFATTGLGYVESTLTLSDGSTRVLRTTVTHTPTSAVFGDYA